MPLPKSKIRFGRDSEHESRFSFFYLGKACVLQKHATKQKGNLETASAWLKRFWPEIQPFYPQSNAQWLHYGLAAEILCKPHENFKVSEAFKTGPFLTLRKKTSVEDIDVNIVELKERRKKLLIADMDSTIITSESLDQLAQMAGIGCAVEAITKRSIAGEIDFSEALIDRVKLLTGNPSEFIGLNHSGFYF